MKMEMLTVVLFLLMGISCHASLQNEISNLNLPGLDTATQNQIEKIILLVTSQQLHKIVSNIQIDSKTFPSEKAPGLPIPIELPPLNLVDEIYLNSILDLSFSEPAGGSSSGLLTGDFHVCNGLLSGLSSIDYTLEVNVTSASPLSASVTFGLTGSEKINGTHSIGAEILPVLLSLSIESFGYFEVAVENGFLILDVNLILNEDFNVEVESVFFDIGFDKFTIYADASAWNGMEVDWNATSYEIVDSFNSFWPVLRRILNPVLADVLNTLLTGLRVDAVGGGLSYSGVPPTNELILEEISKLVDFDFETREGEVCEVTYTLAPTEGAPDTEDDSTTESSAANFQLSGIILLLGMLTFMNTGVESV